MSKSSKILPHERLGGLGLHANILTLPGESVIVRQPFRWLRNGQVISSAYESRSMEDVCTENNWEIVVKYGEHIAVVKDPVVKS